MCTWTRSLQRQWYALLHTKHPPAVVKQSEELWQFFECTTISNLRVYDFKEKIKIQWTSSKTYPLFSLLNGHQVTFAEYSMINITTIIYQQDELIYAQKDSKIRPNRTYLHTTNYLRSRMAHFMTWSFYKYEANNFFQTLLNHFSYW